MYYSIQHFLENGIPQLEENQKKFMRDPSCFGECVTRVGQIMMVKNRFLALFFCLEMYVFVRFPFVK